MLDALPASHAFGGTWWWSGSHCPRMPCWFTRRALHRALEHRRARAAHVEELQIALRERAIEIPLDLLHSRSSSPIACEGGWSPYSIREGRMRVPFWWPRRWSRLARHLLRPPPHGALSMSSLCSGAGRCARFEGEAGTVHVYPLPDDERAWLPTGLSALRTQHLPERVPL